MSPLMKLSPLLIAIACALPALAQSDETAKRFHVLPHLVDGGGWRSFLLVTNVSEAASPCTLQLYGLGVDRFEDYSADGVTAEGSMATFELPASGGYLVWPTRNESALASGYATLDCVNPVAAQVVFAWIGSAGTPTGMATVFSSQTATVFQIPVLTPAATLGFAIANDTNAEASCRVRLADPEGTILGEAMLSVPMKSNHAELLNEAIPIPETFLEGSAKVECDQPVAMIGLHYELRPDGSIITFNTLPPARVDPTMPSSDETAKRFHVLPHIADGGGWRSSLLVTNVSPSASPCTLQLYGGLGVDRFEAAAGVTAAGLTATFALAGAGGHLVWRTRNELAEASGYATLDCVHPVVAQVVFAWIDASGMPTGMATVFSSQAGEAFQLPVLTSAGTLGFAIANDTNAEASCRIVLEDYQRTNLGEATLSVPAKSNRAQMLNDAIAIPGTFFGGTATVACNQPVAMIGLHFELRDGTIITFSTLPPAVIDVVRPTAKLSASPSAIGFGETTTLTWSSTNAVSAVITPDIGEVEPSGSREVSPSSTTTFRITVTSADGVRATASTTVTVTAAGPADTDPQGSVASDRAALEAIYDATRGWVWTDSTNWKTAAPLGEWYGVETNEAGRVRSLDLYRNRLTGPIPTELANLVQLENLDLTVNNLGGPIPGSLGSLTQLRRLGLNTNDLSGPIPAELGNLVNLRELKLGANDLRGPIPVELGDLANLRFLSLDSNRYLSGPIPAELGKLANLRELELERNNLTGPIPPELGSLIQLIRLSLHANDLSGPIPAELGNLVNLRYLTLRGNDLRGPIPARLGALANLIELDLAFIWGLSGPLPSGLIEQSSLKELDIFVTQACAPAAWQEWLATIEFFGVLCEVGDDVTTVDVAVVYTPAARELASGTAGIEAAIDLMVAETNEAYAASGVRHRLALVDRSEVRYTEAGDGGIDLDRLIDPEDGYMDDVHTLRDRAGADLVHLIVGKAPGLCGVAILPGAFALTVLDCGGIVMAHEIGHNMGLYHDRFSGQLRRGGMSSHPAFGYVNQRLLDAGAAPSSRWRTIMAYRDQCRLADVYCSWLPRFSNPRQRHNGDPLGVAYGTGENGATGAADAAAVLNATSPAVAAWRERPAGDNRVPVARSALVGIPVALLAAGEAAGQNEGLFRAVEPTAAVGARASSTPLDSLTLRRRLVSINFGQLALPLETAAVPAAPAGVLRLNLFNDASFTVLVEGTAPTFSGGYSLSGRLAGVEMGTVTLVVNGDVVVGTVRTPETTYRIRPAGGGLHAVSQIDPARLPPPGEPIPRRRLEEEGGRFGPARDEPPAQR